VSNPKTKLSKEFPEKLKNKFSELRELHKIEIVENILNEHDFEKAIIFVDRVCGANKIFEKFQNLNPVLFLGRLRIGLEKQKEVLEKAQKPEHKLIISTSAGEEGVDLPTVGLTNNLVKYCFTYKVYSKAWKNYKTFSKIKSCYICCNSRNCRNQFSGL
jgi:ERCC4-related helicase